MKKTETKPSEAENRLEIEEKKPTDDERVNALIDALGSRCEAVNVNPAFPVCVVGNRINILHMRGVKRVLIIKEME